MAEYLGVADKAALDFTYDFYVNEVMAAEPMPEAAQIAGDIDVLAASNPKVKTVNPVDWTRVLSKMPSSNDYNLSCPRTVDANRASIESRKTRNGKNARFWRRSILRSIKRSRAATMFKQSALTLGAITGSLAEVDAIFNAKPESRATW
jgi:hypothetical protein